MAIRSGFFNSIGGDRKYNASEFAEYFAAFIGSGVFPDPITSLQVMATTGLNLKIQTGKAWINGFILISDSDIVETVSADAVLHRIDRLVVRLHYANRVMSIIRKTGSLSSTPVAPVITRDAEMFELSLATILINAGTTVITSGMISDTRGDSNACGFVSSTITNIPYMTPSRALVSNSSGELSISAITELELSALAGVSSAIQAQINSKQATISGGASSITSNNLTISRALVSDGSGKVSVSAITSAELAFLAGINSAIQTQLNSKQATVTGGSSSILTTNLTINKALISDSSGKVAISSVTNTELAYLIGVTSAIQTQLNAKLGSSDQSVDSLKISGKKITVGTVAPTSPAVGDIWIDTN